MPRPALPQQQPERLLSEKSGRHGVQQMRHGALPMIDRGDYPSGNRPFWTISGLHCRGAGYGQFEHKADSLIAKIQEAGGTVREIDVWAESRLLTFWFICIIIRLSRAVNHYRDNALPTKPSATKIPENWSWRTRQLLTCRCVSVVLLRSMQNTRRS